MSDRTPDKRSTVIPGPWQINPNDFDAGSASGHRIQRVGDESWEFHAFVGSNRKENEATARLITAAPDLYEALVAVLNPYRVGRLWDGPCNDNSSGDYCLAHETLKPCAYRLAYDALKKAVPR